MVEIAEHWWLMLLSNFHDVPCLLLNLELILIPLIVFFYFDDNRRLLFLSQMMSIICTLESLSGFWLSRLLYYYLLFKHLHHFFLLLLFFSLLHHCHCSRFFTSFSFLDLLKVFLDLKFLHLFFEKFLILLWNLLIQCFLASLLRLLRVYAILIFFLRFHYTFLSLFFFGLIIGALFEFF